MQHVCAQVTPVHLAVVLFEDPEGIGRQAVLKCANEDALRSIVRVLKKRLVKLPQISPPPDQASTLCCDMFVQVIYARKAWLCEMLCGCAGRDRQRATEGAAECHQAAEEAQRHVP